MHSLALCLWLPTFELRLELVRAPELDGTSVALLSPETHARRTLWQVCERAWHAGVRPGQGLAQAIALCPSLTLLEPDPTHYDTAREEVLEALGTLSPVIQPDEERGKIFLGMSGLGRLHGSAQNQIHLVLQRLLDVLPPALVATTRAGMAPGTFGAWVAAVRARPGQPCVVADDPAELARFLEHCPVTSLPVDPATIERLERLGLSTLGQVARLPEGAMVAQFGAQGRDARAWARGERMDPVRPRFRPRPIRVTLDLPAPAGQLMVLNAALRRLLDRGLASPARRGRSIHTFRLIAQLEHKGSWGLEVVLRQPSAHAESLAFALRSKLELAPPPRAVTSLTLEFTGFAGAAQQNDLFSRDERSGRAAAGHQLAGGKVPAALRDAVRELKLRLGHSPLYRVVELDPWSRIPERRHALLNFDPTDA